MSLKSADSADARPSWNEAAAWSVGISILLNILYSSCNWFTSRRANVGHCYFDWELRVPFVAFMIVPYLSINLFFMGAFFLCRSRRELQALNRQLLLAMAIAIPCFLLFPLEAGFVRPTGLPGFTGYWLDFLHGVDKPFNLCPSLHITFWIILWSMYHRHTKGWLRWANNAWFSLVGPSTMLTYQHHIVDIAGGLVLGALCLKVFPAEPLAPQALL